MPRSLKKGPFVDLSLEKKVDAANASNDKRQGTPSAAGEALHKFPPIVPKF